MCEPCIAHWVAATANSGCFILICLYTLPLWALRKEQWGHANGFSPVWVRRCRPKSTGLRKERPHWGHAWPASLPATLSCIVVSRRVWLGAGGSRVSRWERVVLDDAPACRKNKSGFSIDFGSPLASTHKVCTPWMMGALRQSSVLILADQFVMVMMMIGWRGTIISASISQAFLYTHCKQCSKEKGNLPS